MTRLLRTLPFLSVLCFGAGADWIEHKDPQGFVIKHPPNWVVETPEKSMVVVHDPGGANVAIAYGFLDKPELTAQQWLNQVPARFAARFQKAQFEPLPPGSGKKSPDEVVAQMRYSSRFGDGKATVLVRYHKGAGMMFAIGAPYYRFKELAPNLVAILQTFVVTGPGGNGSGQQNGQPRKTDLLAGIEWVKWSDPAEHAYSLDVPKGWKVEGGIVRRSAVDVHAWNRWTSPDGQTMIFSDDRDRPAIVQIPNQMNTQFRTPGQAVMPYQPGVIFAENWARRIAGGQINIKEKRVRDDLNRQAAQLHAPYNTAGINTTDTYGEISFAVGSKAGYILAGTTVTNIQGSGGYWSVAWLTGFLCPPDKARSAMAIANHIVQSSQSSAAWFNAQQKTTAAVSKMTQETAEHDEKIITESYWEREKAKDRANQNFDDYIRDVTRVKDPSSGKEYEAPSGSNYYYLDDDGKVQGTNTAPVNVTQLMPAQN